MLFGSRRHRLPRRVGYTNPLRARSRPSRRGLGERLMAEVNRQLEAKQLILKHGTIVDATVVAAAVNPPAGPKGTVAPGTGAAQDPDAQWSTRKDGGQRHYHFGYKAHVGVDAGSGLVRKAILTGAKTNESVVGDALIGGDEHCVYGDKAYDSDKLAMSQRLLKFEAAAGE